jgi:hypothetical protein
MTDPYEGLSTLVDELRSIREAVADAGDSLSAWVGAHAHELEPEHRRELAKRAARISGLSNDVLAAVRIADDCADYLPCIDERDTLQSVTEMFRDVERGIRDPSELRYAIERIEPNYVL